MPPRPLSLPLEPGKPERTEHLSFSPGGTHLAVVRQRRGTTGRTAIGTVLLFRMPEGAPVASLMGESAVFVSDDTLVKSRHQTYGYLVSTADGEETQSVGIGPPIAVAPTAGLIAAAGYGGTLLLCEQSNPDKPVAFLTKGVDDNRLVDLAFSPDARLLAAAFERGDLRVFRVTPTGATPLMANADARAYRVAFSPDGSSLAIGKRGAAVEVLRASDGSPLFSVAGPEARDAGASVAYSPDGARLAIGGDQAVHLVNARTGALEASLDVAGESLAYAPDGSVLAAAGALGVVFVEARGASAPAQQTAAPEGSSLVSPRTATREREPGGGPGPVQSVAFSDDGATLASAVGASLIVRRTSDLAVLQALDLAPASQVVHRTSFMGPHEVLDLRCDVRLVTAFSPHGAVVCAWAASSPAAGFVPHEVLVRRAVDGALVARLSSQQGPVRQVLVDRGGARAITLAEGASIFDLAAGGRLLGQAQAEAAAFHPDGRVALSVNGEVTLFGARAERIGGHGAPVSTMAFDGAGRLLAMAGGGQVTVVSLETGRALFAHKTSPGAVAVSIDHSGSQVAVADGALRVYRLSDGAVLGSASSTNAATVRVAAFSARSPHIAWGVEQTSQLCVAQLS